MLTWYLAFCHDIIIGALIVRTPSLQGRKSWWNVINLKFDSKLVVASECWIFLSALSSCYITVEPVFMCYELIHLQPTLCLQLAPKNQGLHTDLDFLHVGKSSCQKSSSHNLHWKYISHSAKKLQESQEQWWRYPIVTALVPKALIFPSSQHIHNANPNSWMAIRFSNVTNIKDDIQTF